MHTALFQETGVDAVYVAFDVRPKEMGHLATAIRTLDIRGANLTVPFKRAILGELDHTTRAVHEAGAANVVIQHSGHLTGYNTDGEGFCRGFEESFGAGILGGSQAYVLGAGGAGRAVAAGLADRGAAQVVLLNRTLARAEQAAGHLAQFFPKTDFLGRKLTPEAFAAAADCEVVVNCTSGDASPAVAALDIGVLSPRTIWCDINYWMDDPPLLGSARARGLRTQEGLPMLVHQGALSFELFTGIPIEAERIYKHLS